MTSAVFLLLLLTVGALNIHAGTRYTLFLFPILVLLAIGSFRLIVSHIIKNQLVAKSLTAGIVLIIFVLSNDFAPDHLIHIDTSKYNFRKVYNSNFESHFIKRRDFKGAAQYLEENVKDGDIVISTQHTIHYYTNKIKYILFDYANINFQSYTARKGKKDRWTNRDLLYRVSHLFNLIENTDKDVWIVANIKKPRKDEKAIMEKYKENLIFSVGDGILGVYKIEKAS